MSMTTVDSKRSLFIISGVISAVAITMLVYLMIYTAPVETNERVKVIANIAEGCIVETYDGYAINIGPCNGQPDQYIVAPIDQKLKERAALMNPTR